MGHGDHWHCLHEDIEELLERYISVCTEKGQVVDKVRAASRSKKTGERIESQIYSCIYPGTDLSVQIIHQAIPKPRKNRFVSGFPSACSGIETPIAITESRPWANGLEGVVLGKTDAGAELAFFDTRFYKNKDRYRPGERLLFELSGLAYNVQCMNGCEVVTDDQNALECFYEALGETPKRDEDGLIPPLVHPADGAVSLTSSSDEYPEDMEYHCVVDSVESFALDDIRIFKVHTTLLPTEPALEGILYVGETVLTDGYRLNEGDSIGGLLWLQGRLMDKPTPE